MYKLSLTKFRPSSAYRSAVLTMPMIDLTSFLNSTESHLGHSPFAFRKITFWLRYNCGMSLEDIANYFTDFKPAVEAIAVHKNSWIRWSSPHQKAYSTNMNYSTWVFVEGVLNNLLSKYDRSIIEFTKEPTYTPQFMKQLRTALELSPDGFGAITGLGSAERIHILESTDVSINERGLGFENWLEVIEKLYLAQRFKVELEANPVSQLAINS